MSSRVRGAGSWQRPGSCTQGAGVPPRLSAARAPAGQAAGACAEAFICCASGTTPPATVAPAVCRAGQTRRGCGSVKQRAFQACNSEISQTELTRSTHAAARTAGARAWSKPTQTAALPAVADVVAVPASADAAATAGTPGKLRCTASCGRNTTAPQIEIHRASPRCGQQGRSHALKHVMFERDPLRPAAPRRRRRA